MLKVNNRNTRTKSKICSKLTIKTPERRQWARKYRLGNAICHFTKKLFPYPLTITNTPGWLFLQCQLGKHPHSSLCKIKIVKKSFVILNTCAFITLLLLYQTNWITLTKIGVSAMDCTLTVPEFMFKIKFPTDFFFQLTIITFSNLKIVPKYISMSP